MVFVSSLYFLTLVFVALYLSSLYEQRRNKQNVSAPVPVATDEEKKAWKLQQIYLIPYFLAVAADWVQADSYALYESYALTSNQIEQLFLAGFGASVFGGTIVGSLADKFGRRGNCILYGILYGLACLTKHYPIFKVLMVGRVLSGIATSLLFTSFESWLICEHAEQSLSKWSLKSVVIHASLGNSAIAILSGLIANVTIEQYGHVAPFDVSFLALMVMCILLGIHYKENYGDSDASAPEIFKLALKSIFYDPKIILLGVVQILFEGAMYTFILNWSQALTLTSNFALPAIQPELPTGLEVDLYDGGTNQEEEIEEIMIPHAWIFADFMVSTMIGVMIFKWLCSHYSMESFVRIVLFISAVALAMPVFVPLNPYLIFIGFLVFQVCVGIISPALCLLRANYLPNTCRCTILNLFRIPLNCIIILMLQQEMPLIHVFKTCVSFILVACVLQQLLFSLVESSPKKTSKLEKVRDKSKNTNSDKKQHNSKTLKEKVDK